MEYGFVSSPYGNCMIAWRGQQICALFFTTDKTLAEPFGTRNDGRAEQWAEQIFTGSSVNIFLEGSPLQMAVWRALQHIPKGETMTYTELAAIAGYPRAVRAVATAVGQNPVSYLVPCHRVVRKDGSLGGYRWGLEVKKMLLKDEQLTLGKNAPANVK